MTAQELMANCVTHNACADGLVWLAGKDSDAIWASTDEVAAPYLFWWAAVNAGVDGWKNQQEVVAVLQEIASSVQFSLPQIDPDAPDFSDRVLCAYARVEQRMERLLKLTEFRLNILPLVCQLRGTI